MSSPFEHRTIPLDQQIQQRTTVPPTPGPRSKNNIYDDVKTRFAGVICVNKDTITTTLDEYFSDFDYWELYSESKSYSRRSYQAAYKGVMKNYHNYICIIDDCGNEEYYVVAKHIRSELENLEPFCQCNLCSASVINPLKYIWCPHCTGCIKAGPGFANTKFIEQAKALKLASQQKRPSKYTKYTKFFDNIGKVKLIEASFVGLVTIAVLYFFVSKSLL